MSYAVASFPLLAAFFVFVAWRVRVERGVVLREPTALDLLHESIRNLEREIGVAFAPFVEKLASDFVAIAAAAGAYNRAMRRFDAALLRFQEAQVSALSRILLRDAPDEIDPEHRRRTA